jgi:hypothetical protein
MAGLYIIERKVVQVGIIEQPLISQVKPALLEITEELVRPIRVIFAPSFEKQSGLGREEDVIIQIMNPTSKKGMERLKAQL